MKVMLANIDYETHMTDEGLQLQEGFRGSGWRLSGVGYDGLRDVPEIIRTYQPERILVHDKRDWDPDSGICFRDDVGFRTLSYLSSYNRIGKTIVVKDAGSMTDYQLRFCREVNPDSVLIYYHPRSVLAAAPWLRPYRLVRTFHTVDTAYARSVLRDRWDQRRRGVVTGAISPTYPMRKAVVKAAARLGIDVIRHPGYGNRGTMTPGYLRLLSGYRVHVATASRYGFALRKIIESVVCGCTPVTNLPTYDVLPEIDGALVRVPLDAGIAVVSQAVARAARDWDPKERRVWSEKALAWYDYREMGRRIDRELAGCVSTV